MITCASDGGMPMSQMIDPARPMTDRMIGITGRPGSGKTSLLVGLVGELTRRGLTVSTMIGADDPAAIDQPGKDSFRHRAAGAEEVMVTSAQRWALIHGGGATDREPVAQIPLEPIPLARMPMAETPMAQMTGVDLVITEGMGGDGYPMIEVHRAACAAGEPPLGRDDSAIVAVVSDRPLDGLQKPVIDLADVPAVADFIVAHMGLAGAA